MDLKCETADAPFPASLFAEADAAVKGPAHKSEELTAAEPGRQYAALPWRDHGGLEILLVTSRETRRWVIPKGWPMKGRKPRLAAAREAFEEAGVVGRVDKTSLGAYHYVKRLKNGAQLTCLVEVFALKVQRRRKRWPEQHQRTVRWFSAQDAAEAVHEPELQALIEAFSQTAAARRESGKPGKPPAAAAAPVDQGAPDGASLSQGAPVTDR